MPGIAGVTLTIGIGIDSNVLIFERIREEPRAGKTAASAVATGFNRVFVTLVDTHLAALISAAFLFLFGTGPIKGFAVALVIGLVSNMFTAVFVSRTLFEWSLARQGDCRKDQYLTIFTANALFTDDARRNPFALYHQVRSIAPVFHEPASDIWMIFDYDGVKQALSDSETFSSKRGPDWLIFNDPPRHSMLRALVSQAFTPRSIAILESRIRDLSRELLNASIENCQIDLATDFAIPLPLIVIAEMLGIPTEDRSRFRVWNDMLLRMSYTVVGPPAPEIVNEFMATTKEMNTYLTGLLEMRRKSPTDDLLTRLIQAEVDGERLTQDEILGFFQLLLLAGSETTTNLINNAFVCFMDHPEQLGLLRQSPDLLPSAIEEVLRYRSPLQWMYRVTTRDAHIHGKVIPAGRLVLIWMGSANRDPKQFPDPDRFDITRTPNPHVAFGNGIHFCLGAPLSRLEGRVALTELLARMKTFAPATSEPWMPRQGLHVHGPASLPIRFEAR